MPKHLEEPLKVLHEVSVYQNVSVCTPDPETSYWKSFGSRLSSASPTFSNDRSKDKLVLRLSR
jgi:hypothetical protein